MTLDTLETTVDGALRVGSAVVVAGAVIFAAAAGTLDAGLLSSETDPTER